MNRFKILSFILCISFALGVGLFFGTAIAQQKTDGPEGSEFKGSSTKLSGYGWELGLDVGSVFLHTSRHSGYDTGIGFGGHIEYFIDDIFSLNFATGYSHHTGSGGMNNLFFDIGPRARLIYDPIAPFLSISPGFVWQKFGSPVDDSAFSFMIDFGAGIDLLVHDHITLGLTYKYHLVFDQNVSGGVTGTADFQSLMLKVDYVF